MTNILLVSNDYGSTTHNVELFKYLKKNKSFLKPHLITTKLTLKYIKENNLKPLMIIDNDKLPSNKDIVNLIRKKNIKFIVTGLSIDKNNIDTFFLKIAKDQSIDTGVIQDYWGYIGSLKENNLPNIMWVLDLHAKKLTNSVIKNMNIKITGSVKHSKKLNLKYNIKTKKIYQDSILIIGQPIHIAGVKKFYENLAICFRDMPSSIKFFFKEHPADKKSFNFIKKEFGKNRIKNISIIDSFDECIKYCKIILSCYSSVGIDHGHMNYSSNLALGCFFNITIGKEINNTIKKYVHSSNLPPCIIGINNQIKYKKDLQIIRKEFLLPKIQKTQFKKAKKYFFYKKNPCKKIEDDIKHIIKLNNN